MARSSPLKAVKRNGIRVLVIVCASMVSVLAAETFYDSFDDAERSLFLCGCHLDTRVDLSAPKSLLFNGRIRSGGRITTLTMHGGRIAAIDIE